MSNSFKLTAKYNRYETRGQDIHKIQKETHMFI